MTKKLKHYFEYTLALTTVLIFLFLISSTLQNHEQIGIDKKLEHFTLSGQVSIDGGPFQEISGTDWYKDTEKSLLVVGRINNIINHGKSLILWPRELRVRLYVNGILKISTGERSEFPSYITYAGDSYQTFYVGDITPKDQIHLEVEKIYSKNKIDVLENFFNHLCYGSLNQFYQIIMHYEIIHPVIGVALVMLGFMLLVTTLLLSSTLPSNNIKLLYLLGIYGIVSGVCYICDSCSEYWDLFFPSLVFNYIIDLFYVPALLFVYLLFILSQLQHIKLKRIFKKIVILFFIAESIPLILQFTGIRDLYLTEGSYIFVGGIFLLTGYGFLLYDIFILKNKSLRTSYISIFPLTLCLILKIISILIGRDAERSYLRIGFLESFLVIFYHILMFIRKNLELSSLEQKNQKLLEEAQIAIMLSQIQPHFLFNTLNTLQHICMKNCSLAADGIQHLALYLRGNTDALSTKEPIPFEKELEHVKHYLYIQQLRFGERVRVEYHLEVTDFTLPTLTLQPIVENAVRHGITKQLNGGTITISTRSIQDEIWIIVTDDGIGIENSTKNTDGNKHVGIQNVKKRLELQCCGTLEIGSNNGKGTKVIIRLKRKGLNQNEDNGC